LPKQFARFSDLAARKGELNYENDTLTPELLDKKPEAGTKKSSL
jgi:hypothetical protein